MHFFSFSGSIETHMNESSHPMHEKSLKVHIWDGSPPQGLSLGTAGQGGFSSFPSLIRRGGVPSGAAEFIAFDR
jgi:hypothetical protein